MKKVKELNKSIEVTSENMDDMITELLEREEFSCTGNVSCAGNACGAKDVNF